MDTHPQSFGDAPVEPKHLAQMEALAEAIDKFFNGADSAVPRETGFVLLVFPFGEYRGQCSYVSNGAARDDIATLLGVQVARIYVDANAPDTADAADAADEQNKE